MHPEVGQPPEPSLIGFPIGEVLFLADSNKPEPSKNAPVIIHRNRNRKTGPVKVRRVDQRPGLFRYTVTLLYKNLYILGITLLRRRLRLRRHLKRWFAGLRGRLYSRLERMKAGLAQFGKKLIWRLKRPFGRVAEATRRAKLEAVNRRQEGKLAIGAYWQVVRAVLGLLLTILRTLLNYALPVVTAVFLYTVITTQMSKNIGLEVEYNGQIIGFVETEADFEAAAWMIKDRYISEEVTALITTPKFTLREAGEGEESYTDRNKLADAILEASSQDIVEGYGFYIEEDFYGAVLDKNALFEELESIKSSYSTGVEGEKVDFVKKVVLTPPRVYPLSSVVEQEELEKHLYAMETVEEIYTVEYGDSPSLISTKTGVSFDDIVVLNPELEDEDIRPGMDLVVNQARPFLTVKNIYTEVYDVEVAYEVEEIPTDTYVKGYRVVSVKGQPGLEQVTAEVSRVGGVEISRNIIDRVPLRTPVTEKLIVGTHNPADIPANVEYAVSEKGFMWPTAGGSINVGLGGYPGHTGVDIPRDSGTPIFASMSGVVVKAVNGSTGYGRHVIIDHGNGYTTLYAHAVALHVQVGQVVKQGDVIASVGRTGRATGNHLHFEVRQNGQVMNPRHYIG